MAYLSGPAHSQQFSSSHMGKEETMSLQNHLWEPYSLSQHSIFILQLGKVFQLSFRDICSCPFPLILVDYLFPSS